jgi:hypothetical protein
MLTTDEFQLATKIAEDMAQALCMAGFNRLSQIRPRSARGLSRTAKLGCGGG